MTRVRLCFHDRCFDGTASAALFYRFYREKFDVKAEFGFTGMTHRAKQPWEPGLFDGDENAIVDFKYSNSPKVTWWFDHHQSAFLTMADAEQFKQAPGKNFYYEPDYKSCTKLIADTARQKFGFDTAPLADLIYWGDIIDGAQFPTPESAVELKEPATQLALVIEAARAIKATGLLPRRTLRFILFSGEEQGTVGSYGYVAAHRAELDKMRAVIVYDTGSGRVTGYSLGGRKDIEAGVKEVLKPLDSWGATNHTADASFGTDNFDFLLEGVPNLVANQEISNYLVNYHAASDTFDKVDLRELKLNTALAALTAWGIADRAEPLGKRLSRAELDVLVKETGLDQQMKVLGYWDAWQSGERGRKP